MRRWPRYPASAAPGSGPVQLGMPRGLWLLPHRRALIVADSANHRLQLFDPASLQLLDIWGQADVAGVPQPGTEPGRFHTPWALTGDTAGNVYVVDYGNQRVQKFNPLGEVVPAFSETLQAAGLQRPSDIAAGAVGETTHLYIVAQDAEATSKVFVFDTEGHPVLDAVGHPITFGAEHLRQPMGIAAGEDAVYVGDNGWQRVLTFKRDGLRRDGSFILAGEAVGYQGPVAALALDGQGNLLVHTGTSLAPVRLAINRGYRTEGMLWSRQAVTLGEVKVNWHRLQALTEELVPNAHLRFFLYTSNDAQANPPKPDPRGTDPAPWRRLDLDVTDMLIGGDPACCLWIGTHFSGDGRVTPVVSQMRVEFDHQTYLRHLPAIYSNTLQRGDFLARFVSLFESFFGGVEAAIARLPALFDPHAAPQEFLPWLAGWLALELDEDWDEAQQRGSLRKLSRSTPNMAPSRACAILAPVRRGECDHRRADPQCRMVGATGGGDSRMQVLRRVSSARRENPGRRRRMRFSDLPPCWRRLMRRARLLGTTATLDHSHLHYQRGIRRATL